MATISKSEVRMVLKGGMTVGPEVFGDMDVFKRCGIRVSD